jgi:long-chain acyl-CoA synthetase
VSNIKAIMPLIPLSAGERALSFLPICHIFERVVSYAYTWYGANVTFTGTDNLGGETGDLRKVKPHFFTAVPRLLEKVYEKIVNKGLELTGAKKKLFFWALELTEDFEYDKEYTGLAALKRKIADKLIFSKWREALGGSVRGIVTGASPLPVMIARTFSAAGVPIREGYGLTESSPGISITRFEKGYAKLGTVGPVIDGGQIMIDNRDGTYREGEGEIMYAGPNVMLGYYNKPVETAEMIEVRDGVRWLRTGDVGMLIDTPKGPFLKITDRKKELLKTSGGKYVAPLPIESKLKEHFLVDQVMVVGDNRKFVSALIIPAQDALKDWCSKKGIKFESVAEAVKDPQVQQRYQWIVDKYNPEFGHVEQVKKVTLLANPWEPIKDDGTEAELTPTLKLKRRVIMEKCKDAIEQMYS